VGISNEPLATIEEFIADQGITFPVLHDNAGVYGDYNLPGSESPYPRDFILDADGVIRLAKTEYEPGLMIAVIESLLADLTSVVEPNPPTIPLSPVLLSIYPNPFNPEVQIKLILSKTGLVKIDLIDIRGRIVSTILHEKSVSVGEHTFSFSGAGLSSGVYFVRTELDGVAETQKILKIN